IMKHSYGAAGVGFELGDANADGLVDATDLAILKASFGFEAPTGAVPEPATLLVMAAAGLALLRRKLKIPSGRGYGG
ncbi:MAG TPA: PEP-CTERM sorting domain-containing protein, partial [Phycisphaerae bacterium]|nr:PEP-CTERM sorting domain-containing protein [Phycisphaerae bacterium]